jgi:hypothetical protein
MQTVCDVLSVHIDQKLIVNIYCYINISKNNNTINKCTYVWGDPKIPGIFKKNYLKYLYKFQTLVPFEVLLLLLDAAIPVPLPMLETLSKIFNGNAVKDRWRPLTAFPLEAVLGLLHPVAEGVLRRGLKFQTCTNTLNKFSFKNSGNFWVPYVHLKTPQSLCHV